MQSILMDLRYGLRALRMNAGSTSVAVFILAVGIAANTTIFSIVNALVFRPLPYADADRLNPIGQCKTLQLDCRFRSLPDRCDQHH